MAATEKIKVIKCYKLPFSISKYDNLLIVWNILFGISWQYDTDTHHFSRNNMYKLEKDGVKYTLLPLNNKASSKEILS